MKKDAYYFPHDSNAKDDPKIMLLIDQLGLEGYGIFWVLIEVLRDQQDYKCRLSLVPALAKRYATSQAKIDAVIRSFELFEIEADCFFYSNSLVRRMEAWSEKKLAIKERTTKAINARWEKQRQLKALNESNTCVLPKNNESITNEILGDTIRVDKNKEDKNKEEESRINTNCVPIIESIMSYFSFSEGANFDKFRTINQFVTLLSTTGRLDRFKTQFEAYRLFKDKSGQLKHGFKSFIGSIDNHFADGGWDAENWSEKLKGVINEPDNQQAYSAADTARRVADKLKSELQ